jgi:hypothetical protein
MRAYKITEKPMPKEKLKKPFLALGHWITNLTSNERLECMFFEVIYSYYIAKLDYLTVQHIILTFLYFLL